MSTFVRNKLVFDLVIEYTQVSNVWLWKILLIHFEQRYTTKVFIFINAIQPNIKLPMEMKENSMVNFLELTISSIQIRSSKNFVVNSLHTDHYKESSSHHYQHHLHIVEWFIDIKLDSEVNIIKHIAINDGFNNNIKDKLLSRKLYELEIEQTYPIILGKPSNDKTISSKGKISEQIKSLSNNYDMYVPSYQNVYFNKKNS